MRQKPPTPEQAVRDARRADALRANLKRRKAASRKESAPGAAGSRPETP